MIKTEKDSEASPSLLSQGKEIENFLFTSLLFLTLFKNAQIVDTLPLFQCSVLLLNQKLTLSVMDEDLLAAFPKSPETWRSKIIL